MTIKRYKNYKIYNRAPDYYERKRKSVLFLIIILIFGNLLFYPKYIEAVRNNENIFGNERKEEGSIKEPINKVFESEEESFLFIKDIMDIFVENNDDRIIELQILPEDAGIHLENYSDYDIEMLNNEEFKTNSFNIIDLEFDSEGGLKITLERK